MRFRAKGLVTIQPHVEATFEPLDAVFLIAPATAAKYQEALKERAKKDNVNGAAAGAIISASFSAAGYSPKRPPDGIHDYFELAPGVRPSRDQISQFLRETAIQKKVVQRLASADPDEGKEDALFLVVGSRGLQDEDGAEVAWSREVGQKLFASDSTDDAQRVSGDMVSRVLGTKGRRSMLMGELFHEWVLQVANNEELFDGSEEVGSPNA